MTVAVIQLHRSGSTRRAREEFPATAAARFTRRTMSMLSAQLKRRTHHADSVVCATLFTVTELRVKLTTLFSYE
jgi:hypothetical protein